jgi:hypothetical protein
MVITTEFTNKVSKGNYIPFELKKLYKLQNILSRGVLFTILINVKCTRCVIFD